MNKKFIFFLLTTLIILGYMFKVDKIILIEINQFSNHIKSTYKQVYKNTSSYINKYFNQANIINTLQEQNNINNEYKLKYLISRYELEKLQNILLTTAKKPNVKYVEILSYENLNDFSKVILDTNEKLDTNILALATKDGYSAGIVLEENNQIVAYLNQNEKCNYAVFIGDNNAPGITSGQYKNSKNIVIKHIPKWHKISLHDKVYTSGMDNIFPKGINVGKVIQVILNENTQTAIIQTSKNVLSDNYFYIIKRDK
jgi:rod shape-determining protein MreC